MLNETTLVLRGIIMNSTTTKMKKAIEQSCNLNIPDEETEISNNSILKNWLSNRTINLLSKNDIHTTRDLMDFVCERSVWDLSGIGRAVAYELYNYLKNLAPEENRSKVQYFSNHRESCVFTFINVPSSVDGLSICGLKPFGVKKRTIDVLVSNGIVFCGDLRFLSNRELEIIVGKKGTESLTVTAYYLKQGIVSMIKHVLDYDKPRRAFGIVLRRAKGETLSIIALTAGIEEAALTKQRIRQIEKKYLEKIEPFVVSFLDYLIKQNIYTNINSINKSLENDDYAKIILYTVAYFDNHFFCGAEHIMRKTTDDLSSERALIEAFSKVLEGDFDLATWKETVNRILDENNCIRLDNKAINIFLENHIFSRKKSKEKRAKYHKAICIQAIKDYFPEGITLIRYSEEDTEDLITLKKLVYEEYGVELDYSNYYMVAHLLPDNGFVPKNSSQYIFKEKVVCNDSLFKSIISYIDNSKYNTVYYQEIFNSFKEPLIKECGIENHYCLHGILKMNFPDLYNYRRFHLIKKDSSQIKKDNIASNMYTFICSVGEPVTTKELRDEFGDLYEYTFQNCCRDERLFQWGDGQYSCTGILNLSKDDEYRIKRCIIDVLTENNGYTSAHLLYEKMCEIDFGILDKYNINTDLNLFYLSKKLFSDEFGFRKPHIYRKELDHLSQPWEIALYLMNYPDRFSSCNYWDIADKMKWSDSTSFQALDNIEKEYLRIDETDYVHSSLLKVSDSIICCIQDMNESLLKNGYTSIFDYNMERLPDYIYPWNEYLLTSIITVNCHDLDVFYPNNHKRSSNNWFIVRKSEGIDTLSKLVARLMLDTGKSWMDKKEFAQFLRNYKIITKSRIPNELENSKIIKKVLGHYTVAQ